MNRTISQCAFAFARAGGLSAAIFLGSVGVPAASAAQSTASTGRRADFETRAHLEEELKRLEAANLQGDASLIRQRLEEGDFVEGDRIAIIVKGAAGFQDTLLVRAARRLELPNVGDLPLQGVLRSELVPRLTAHLGQYLRDPAVQATPLVRVGVLGRVAKPGYYHTAADLPLSDVLMMAGGPTIEADLTKISVRRGSSIIMNEQKTRMALTAGLSIDQMHIRAGDEVTIGELRRLNWSVITAIVTGVLGLVLAVVVN